jgi:hypothetical protein
MSSILRFWIVTEWQSNCQNEQQVYDTGTRSTNIDFNVVLDTRKTAKMISHSDQVVFFYIVGQGRGKALGCTKRISFEEPYELNIRDYISDLIPRFSANGQDLFRLQRTYISIGVLHPQRSNLSF